MTVEKQQPEAYCLMTYACDDCKRREIIWNSRNGVTPFTVSCAKCAGGMMRHIDWSNDKFAPFHKPKKGDRIFVNLTRERAVADRTRYVDEWWDKDVYGDGSFKMKDNYPDKATAITQLAEADYTSFGAGTTPDILIVEADWL